MHGVDCITDNTRCRRLGSVQGVVKGHLFFFSASLFLFTSCVCICVRLLDIVRWLLCLIPFLPVCSSVTPSKPCWSHPVLLWLCVCCICVFVQFDLSVVCCQCSLDVSPLVMSIHCSQHNRVTLCASVCCNVHGATLAWPTLQTPPVFCTFSKSFLIGMSLLSSPFHACLSSYYDHFIFQRTEKHSNASSYILISAREAGQIFWGTVV